MSPLPHGQPFPLHRFSSWAIEKKGLKFNIVLSCLACAICFGLLGYANSILSFALLFAGVSFFGTGAAYVGGTGLVANWFVRKQALALGFITFGQTFFQRVFRAGVGCIVCHVYRTTRLLDYVGDYGGFGLGSWFADCQQT